MKGEDFVATSGKPDKFRIRSLRRRKIRRENVAQREQFFALLRRVVVLRNEKERKNGPLCRVRNRIIFYGADS